MFFNYILNNLSNNDTYYVSVKPTHHISKYYKEIKTLIETDVLKVYLPSRKAIDTYGKYVFLPAEYKVIDLQKLSDLASKETKLPEEKYVSGHLTSLVNKYNKFINNPFLYMHFNKGRATSPVCSVTSENTDVINSLKRKDRKAFNYSVFGTTNVGHYDVPSSIPQIIHLMNKGFWYGRRVWDELGNDVKRNGQRIAFTGSIKSLAISMFRGDLIEVAGWKSGSAKKMTYHSGTPLFNYIEQTWDSETIASEYYLDLAKKYTEKYEAIVGKLPMAKTVKETKELRKNYFIHESNIYLMVLNKFVDLGVKAYSVYDSFYWDKRSGITEETVAGWVKECAEYYYNHREELMAKEELAFNESSIAHKLEVKERRNRRPSVKNKPSATWKKKVRVWLKNNRGSTNYPKKWSIEEIEYAQTIGE